MTTEADERQQDITFNFDRSDEDIDHTLITDQLAVAYYQDRANRPRYHAKSIRPSSSFQCGFKTTADILGYAPTNEPEKPDYQFGRLLGTEGHNEIQRLLARTPLVYLRPNFDEDKAKREQARARGLVQPAIEYPFTEYTMSAQKFAESRKLGIGKAKKDAEIVGRLKNSKGNLSPSIFEIKMWKNADFHPDPSDKYAASNIGQKLLDHESQMQVYMYLSEDNDGEQVTQGILYAVNREKTTERFAKRFKLRLSYLTPELYRLEDMQGHILRKKLYKPEPNRGPCPFCEYYDLCPLPKKEKRGKRPPTLEEVYGATNIPLISRSKPRPQEELLEEALAQY